MLHMVPLDEATWDAELAAHNQATLFHTSRWLNLLQRTHHVSVERLGIFDGDTLRGLFPILRRRRGPFLRIGSPVNGTSTPYLGPLVPDELLPTTLALFDDIARRERAASVHLSFPHPINLGAIESLGFQVRQRVTLMLPLAGRTSAELWQGLKKNCRAHVRQAEQRGVEIVEAHDPDILDAFWALEQKVFRRRKQRAPNPRRFYTALWDTLRPSGQMNVFVARCAGHIVGVQINGWYQDKLYGLYGAVDDDYRRCSPGNLLEWHLIDWAAKQGMKTYDMIDGTDAGWGEFKRSFGAVPEDTPYLFSDRSRAAALVRSVRQALRRNMAHLGHRHLGPAANGPYTPLGKAASP